MSERRSCIRYSSNSRQTGGVRSCDPSRQRSPGAERIASQSNLLGIIASELLMHALFERSQRSVGDHQRKLVPVQQGIEVQRRSPNAVSGSTSRLLVNIADEKIIRVIDRKTGKQTVWPLPPGHSANFPMVLDEAARRVFIGTRKPSRLTVFNMDTGAVVASVPTAGDMDDIFYDAQRKRIYIAGGEGYIGVIQQTDPDHYVSMGKFASSLGARTGTWYVKRDRLYVAAPPAGGLGARVLVFEAQTD